MKFIYLHGFASSPASRKAQFFAAKLREAGATVQIPELEAEGFLHLTVSGQLRVIAAAAGGEPVRLIGSSMGGYLAALYALLHPEVEKLVLLAPAFGFAERWKLRLGEAAMREWESKGSLEMMHYATGKPEPVGYGLIADGLQYPAEPAFSQPAWIFHGTHDEVVPLAFSEQFVAGHANARLTALESGHELTDVMDQIWDMSAEFLLQAGN
ncbi:YqiA/YcfP family alpha/beta fold hydrolase [Bryobacter aggregatus]|uniref:YqiA/YcfP family alpha/beta fold hydrolase n=1 Tax=Bryobacter aggregatus TaxID=360054 RepID=UPI0004E1A22D|nr:YqiA/YcfP family alpha/beta fold hydrolase [Bryobacter aggregatus]